MSVRSYLREFEDSIYDLVYTDDWTKVEEKMDQDESFTALLLTFVEASLAEDASQSARIRISKTSHPIKKERLLAEETARNTHLAAIEKRQQLERECLMRHQVRGTDFQLPARAASACRGAY